MRTVPSLGYDIFNILKASDWFAGVADDGLAELADAAQIRHIKASQRLYKMGDKTSSLYCLIIWSRASVDHWSTRPEVHADRT